jgi:hypothetical protein
MWVVRPTSVASGLDDHNFQQWLRLWSSDTEVTVTDHESFWGRRDAWAKRPTSEIEASDFSLDEEREHPTILEGTDGQTVGADLAQFGMLLTEPAPASDEDFQNGRQDD